MPGALEPTRYNVAALASVVGALFVAYVLAPGRLVQYGAWLFVFTVWMVWFVHAGVDRIYGIE